MREVRGRVRGDGAAVTLAGPPDRAAELLRRTHCRTAPLALDGEDGGKARAAFGTARSHLAAASRARRRELGLVLGEVPLRVAAGEAEGDPVAERLATLLAQPIRRPAHAFSAYR